MQAAAAALALGLSWLAPAALASYDCSGTETIGEVQGEAGSICSPRCTGDAYTCPSDLPSGVAAQPQCMLEDVNKVAYCGLLCTADTQCPSGCSCKTINQVGICIHPLNFKEWAGSQVARTRLSVSWANRAQGSSSGSFKIAKAYAALQSLKRRFGIAEGDADVLVVKELLQAASAKAAASGSSGASSASAASAPAPSGSGVATASVAALLGKEPATPAPLDNGQAHRDLGSQAFEHDVNYFLNNMENGPAGVEKEIRDTVWNLEHLGSRGVCTELLRSGILIALAYLGIGGFYKYQALGATGVDMIPHVGFWMEYPALVMDGIGYTMATANEFLGGRPVPRAGGIGGQPGDRDTFANFEPSK